MKIDLTAQEIELIETQLKIIVDEESVVSRERRNRINDILNKLKKE